MMFARGPVTQNGSSDKVRRLKSSVRRQILLAVSSLALIAVLAFAMAVAWYTNVTKTGGIQFQTEVWGFAPENITIGDPGAEEGEDYGISPGKTGFIPLCIDNSGNSVSISAVVNVLKRSEEGEMEEELQQRIYFYIDAPRSISYFVPGEEEGDEPIRVTESTPRIWLGSRRTESYTYTVLPGDILRLSEEYRSDAPLKWLWVGDLEGYYFRGTVTEEGVTVDEYLRPIQYVLTDASFDPETGKLTAVDGVPLEEYLTSLFASDGYEGNEFIPENTVELTEELPGENEEETVERTRSCYPITADENGTGIWVYLLDYDEIEAASAFDSALTSNTEINATVSVTVFNNDEPVTDAPDAAALTEALTAPGSSTVRLTGDVELPSVVTPVGSKTIDLNNYYLRYTGEETAYSAFEVPAGSSLTLLNGTLVGNGLGSGGSAIKTVAVTTRGGDATLSGISVSGYDSAVSVDDRALETDGVVKLVNCSFNTGATSVMCYGNGVGSEAKTRLIIENSRITSGYIGVSGNGSEGYWGTEIIILDSRIEGTWAAIYQPQRQSRTVVTGSTLTGYTGIAVKGGTVDLYGCTVQGTGAKRPAANSGSGWTDTGDAVYVEAGYGWSASAFVRGTENVLLSDHGYLLQLYGMEGQGPGKIVSEAGPYQSSEVYWNQIGDFVVTTAEAP